MTSIHAHRKNTNLQITNKLPLQTSTLFNYFPYGIHVCDEREQEGADYVHDEDYQADYEYSDHEDDDDDDEDNGDDNDDDGDNDGDDDDNDGNYNGDDDDNGYDADDEDEDFFLCLLEMIAAINLINKN